MKRFINISFLSLVFAGMALIGCNDDLTQLLCESKR